MATNLMKVVASSVLIAQRAGQEIRTIMKSGNLAVIDKAEKDEKFDPQTQADRTAQSIILGSLTKQYPGLTIVGEEEGCDSVSDELMVEGLDSEVLAQCCPENYKDLNLKDLIVWVDPLDGTREFTEGHMDHVTVLIGISAHGKAIAGIIHQPFYSQDKVNYCGRTMWGVIGLGVFGIKRAEIIPGRRIITTTKSNGTQLVQDAIEALQPDKVIKTGGAGYKVLQLIEGVADAYVFATPGTKKWDTCAPEAVLSALGGTLRDVLNKDINYANITPKHYMNWTGILATAQCHDSFASKVPNNIKESLLDLLKSKV